MSAPTPEQIAKLPKWARDHITNIERERDVSVRALNEFQDSQTPSGIYYDDCVCTGETKGPSNKRKYIQSHQLEVEHAGVLLSVFLAGTNDSQRSHGIQLSWNARQRTGHVAAIPTSFQCVELVAKENMR